MLNFENRHFVIGVSRVSEEVKNRFCAILGELKVNRSEEFRRTKLAFIDKDERDAVYSYLSKPKAFNIEKQLNHQSSLEQLKDTEKKLV
jgi:hypothetical protein